MDNGTIASIGSGFILNALLGFSLNLVWGCLNILQLIVKLPLLNIMFPATANIFNDPMIKIATFDLLDWIDL